MANFVLIDTATWTHEEQQRCLTDLGFCVLIKFRNILSALKLFAREALIAVPIAKEASRIGMPGVVPG